MKVVKRMDHTDFSDIVGKVFTKVERVPDGVVGDSDAIVFTVSEKEQYAMFYDADCCAQCSIDDICGDLNDLVGMPIIKAEENSSEDEWPRQPSTDRDEESFTYTFYRIQTAKGLVVVRWYGSSNGYYSEAASFGRITET